MRALASSLEGEDSFGTQASTTVMARTAATYAKAWGSYRLFRISNLIIAIAENDFTNSGHSPCARSSAYGWLGHQTHDPRTPCRTRGSKSIELERKVLVLRADPRIADVRHSRFVRFPVRQSSCPLSRAGARVGGQIRGGRSRFGHCCGNRAGASPLVER